MQIDLSNRNLNEFDASAFSTDSDLAVLRAIARLDLSSNRLSSLSSLHCLSRLTTLNLAHNRVTSLHGLPQFLRQLNVSFNALTDLNGLWPLQHLEVLLIAHNAIGSLRELPPTLRILDASGNRLSSLAGVERCPALAELQARHNCLREVESLAPLQSLRHLRALTLSANAVTSNSRHAVAIRALLPETLHVIDLPPTVRAATPLTLPSPSSVVLSPASSPSRSNNTSLLPAQHRSAGVLAEVRAELEACRRACAMYARENAALREEMRQLREVVHRCGAPTQQPLAGERQRMETSAVVNRQEERTGKEKMGEAREEKGGSGETTMVTTMVCLLNKSHSLEHSNTSNNGNNDDNHHNSSKSKGGGSSISNDTTRWVSPLVVSGSSFTKQEEIRRGARSLAALFMSVVPTQPHRREPTKSPPLPVCGNDNSNPTNQEEGSYEKESRSGYTNMSDGSDDNNRTDKSKRKVSFGSFAYYSPPS